MDVKEILRKVTFWKLTFIKLYFKKNNEPLLSNFNFCVCLSVTNINKFYFNLKIEVYIVSSQS